MVYLPTIQEASQASAPGPAAPSATAPLETPTAVSTTDVPAAATGAAYVTVEAKLRDVIATCPAGDTELLAALQVCLLIPVPCIRHRCIARHMEPAFLRLAFLVLQAAKAMAASAQLANSPPDLPLASVAAGPADEGAGGDGCRVA